MSQAKNPARGEKGTSGSEIRWLTEGVRTPTSLTMREIYECRGYGQNVSLVKLSGVGIKGSGKIREIEGENVNEQQEEEDARDQASYSPGSGSRESLHPTSPTASASCCQSSVAQESAARPHRRRRTCSMRSPSNRSRPRRGRKAVQPGGRTGCRIGREGWRRTGNGMGTTFR